MRVDVNFIETMDNFANLESAMEYFSTRDNKAEEIAANSYNTFARRYLTPAAVRCPLCYEKRTLCANLRTRLRVTGGKCSGRGRACKASRRSYMSRTSRGRA